MEQHQLSFGVLFLPNIFSPSASIFGLHLLLREMSVCLAAKCSALFSSYLPTCCLVLDLVRLPWITTNNECQYSNNFYNLTTNKKHQFQNSTNTTYWTLCKPVYQGLWVILEFVSPHSQSHLSEIKGIHAEVKQSAIKDYKGHSSYLTYCCWAELVQDQPC